MDLKKAFDTANHQLLYGLLAKYGAPEALIDVVRRLHDNFTLKLKIGDIEKEILYGSGVKQGDIMAPVLFLFLMLAFAETLENKWKNDGNINPIEFKYPTSANGGQLKAQKHNSHGLILHIIQLLYVDDGVFPFDSREDLTKGANEIYHLFKKFGLLMHIGKGDADSKTKAMYFPPSPQPRNSILLQNIQGFLQSCKTSVDNVVIR